MEGFVISVPYKQKRRGGSIGSRGVGGGGVGSGGGGSGGNVTNYKWKISKERQAAQKRNICAVVHKASLPIYSPFVHPQVATMLLQLRDVMTVPESGLEAVTAGAECALQKGGSADVAESTKDAEAAVASALSKFDALSTYFAATDGVATITALVAAEIATDLALPDKDAAKIAAQHIAVEFRGWTEAKD